MARNDITYEGVDQSRHDETFRRGYSLPGETVRLDPASRGGATDADAIDEKVGMAPRMVAATIVSGIDTEDPFIPGGRFVRTVVEYELEGVDDRYPAQAFQPEGGSTQAYGVILEQDDKTWLAPLDASLGHTEADDVVKSAGSPREIFGFGARRADNFHDELHADSFDGFRERVAATPLLGEFMIQSAVAYGDEVGPVRLLAAPVLEDASEQEVAVAREAVEGVVLDGKVDLAVSRSSDFTSRVVLQDGPRDVDDWNETVKQWSMASHGRSIDRSGSANHIMLNRIDALMDEVGPAIMKTREYADLKAATVDAALYASDKPHLGVRRSYGVERELEQAARIMRVLREAKAFPASFDREKQDRFERVVLARTIADHNDTSRQADAVHAALTKRSLLVDAVGADVGINAEAVIWHCLEGEPNPINTMRMDAIVGASHKLIREVSALADGEEQPSAGNSINDLADALHARSLSRSEQTDVSVVLGAERLLGELDDISISGMPAYDTLSKALDAADRDGVHPVQVGARTAVEGAPELPGKATSIAITLAREPEFRLDHNGARTMLLHGRSIEADDVVLATYRVPDAIDGSPEHEDRFNDMARRLGGGDRVTLAGRWESQGWRNARNSERTSRVFVAGHFVRGEASIDKVIEASTRDPGAVVEAEPRDIARRGPVRPFTTARAEDFGR